MSSQSSTSSSRSGRRSAAALGASAVLSLALAGPALAQRPPEPSPNPLPSARSDCVYVGGGTIVECRDPGQVPKQSGAGSANTAEPPTGPAAPAAPKLPVPLAQPTNVPVIGIGAATAAVIAGGVALVAVSRRRPARPA
ncbi:MAG: hypothetical protein HOQ18_17670 [Dermatophilaceae bacterium]|nr:hypothetical protein [Dermatophilaceae bacterium]NUR17716.1 hypothetical protein [Dermatophilaceae bacterium]NUR81982.1 hypothetical protein [Dermatophilaceae bacterium]